MVTFKAVRIEFDPLKSQRNVEVRGLSFDGAVEFEFATALLRIDDRFRDELRIRALGLVNGRVHAVVYTARGDAIRIISFRKANQREQKEYGEWLANRR